MDTGDTVVKSIEVAKQLRQHNDQLKSAYDSLKTEYMTLEKELRQLKGELGNATHSRKKLETECRNLYTKWNQQLQVQASEFEQIQSQMVPVRDLEILRVEMLEEVETTYREKLDWMQSEMERFRDMYTKTHREYELLRVSFQQAETQHSKIVVEQRSDFDKIVTDLQAKIRVLQESADDTNYKHVLQKMEREKSDLQQGQRGLEQEISILREQQSQLTLEKENAFVTHLQQLKECEGKLLVKERECHGFEKRNEDILAELQFHKDMHMESERKLQKLEGEVLQLTSSLQSKMNQIKVLEERMEKHDAELRDQLSQEFRNSQSEYEQSQQRLLIAESDVLKLRDEIETLKRTHAAEITENKQCHATEINQMHQAKQQLAKRVADLEQDCAKSANHSSHEMDLLKKEMDTQRAQIRALSHENSTLHNRIKKLQEMNEDAHQDQSRIKKEMDECQHEYQKLQTEHRQQLQSHHEVIASRDAFQSQIKFLESELETTSSELEHLRASQLSDLQQAKTKFDMEMNQIHSENAELASKMEDLHQQYQRAVNKLKKEKARNKKLATSAKQKIGALNRELSSIRRDHQSDVRSRQFEITNLTKQLHEAERQRDEIKFRLTMDSLAPNLEAATTGGDTDVLAANVDMLVNSLSRASLHTPQTTVTFGAADSSGNVNLSH